MKLLCDTRLNGHQITLISKSLLICRNYWCGLMFDKLRELNAAYL